MNATSIQWTSESARLYYEQTVKALYEHYDDYARRAEVNPAQARELQREALQSAESLNATAARLLALYSSPVLTISRGIQ